MFSKKVELTTLRLRNITSHGIMHEGSTSVLAYDLASLLNLDGYVSDICLPITLQSIIPILRTRDNIDNEMFDRSYQPDMENKRIVINSFSDIEMKFYRALVKHNFEMNSDAAKILKEITK